MMSQNVRPKIKLSQLREIGWEHWDPIGLKEHRKDCEEEYDSYLLRATGLIWHQRPTENVVEYLLDIERSYMGLGDRGQKEVRKTVRRLEDYVSSLNDKD